MNIKDGQVVLVGICSDSNSSYKKGPAKAPSLIREKLFCGSANLSSETGISINNNERFVDVGDFEIGEREDDYLGIENYIDNIVSQGGIPLTLGGDHAITYPILKSLAKRYQDITILHFDAHPDLYDVLDGNRYSHACPFARIMENNLAVRLIQLGIRTMNAHQKAQAEKFSVESYEMSTKLPEFNDLNLKGPLYISFDLDALDPAFAPGVSHFEPGGLSVREVLNIIQNINVPVVGADIVEYNPTYDINGMTAMVAAKLLKEFSGVILKKHKK